MAMKIPKLMRVVSSVESTPMLAVGEEEKEAAAAIQSMTESEWQDSQEVNDELDVSIVVCIYIFVVVEKQPTKCF